MSSVLEGSLTIVYGSKGSPATTRAYRKAAVFLANKLFQEIGLSVRVVQDDRYRKTDVRTDAVILFGGPNSNGISNAILDKTTDVSIDETGLTIGDCLAQNGPHVGMLALVPAVDSSELALVIAASDLASFFSAVDMFSSNSQLPHFVSPSLLAIVFPPPADEDIGGVRRKPPQARKRLGKQSLQHVQQTAHTGADMIKDCSRGLLG